MEMANKLAARLSQNVKIEVASFFSHMSAYSNTKHAKCRAHVFEVPLLSLMSRLSLLVA
jgi:hypothetical protein